MCVCMREDDMPTEGKSKAGIGWLVYPLALRESVTDMYMCTDSVHSNSVYN